MHQRFFSRHLFIPNYASSFIALVKKIILLNEFLSEISLCSIRLSGATPA